MSCHCFIDCSYPFLYHSFSKKKKNNLSETWKRCYKETSKRCHFGIVLQYISSRHTALWPDDKLSRRQQNLWSSRKALKCSYLCDIVLVPGARESAGSLCRKSLHGAQWCYLQMILSWSLYSNTKIIKRQNSCWLRSTLFLKMMFIYNAFALPDTFCRTCNAAQMTKHSYRNTSAKFGTQCDFAVSLSWCFPNVDQALSLTLTKCFWCLKLTTLGFLTPDFYNNCTLHCNKMLHVLQNIFTTAD